jgi:uncharacterized protein
MKQKYFPLGLAIGSAFCNRIQERKQLKNNIQAGRHSLVISPRRFGKTSLVLYTLNELQIPHARIDLFVTVNEKKVETEIIEGVKQIIGQVSTKQQVFQTVKDFIKKLKLKLIIGTDGVNLELLPTESNAAANTIKSILFLLENVLAKYKQEAVFFIDECQEIGNIAEYKGIEGAIRHVAQETQYLNFIFSGSHRHMLHQMFEDRSRPLYHLCERLTLDRINASDYVPFIQKLAEKQWRKPLPATVLTQILMFTEHHPYYINLLCGRIWVASSTLPTQPATITSIWMNYVEEQKPEIAKELSTLSPLQKKIITYIAIISGEELTGKKAMAQLNATSGAIIKVLKVLMERDYIYQLKSGAYCILDPVIKTSIQQSSDGAIFE